MAEEKAIIIVKKKGGHGGHHGGAWKVAYADFVTAMMAFFMVMWLINSAETAEKLAIAQYFRKPGIFDQGSGVPLLLGGAGILPDAFAPNLASRENKFTAGLHQVPMTKRSGDEDAIKKGQQKLQGEAGRGVIENGPQDTSGYGLKDNSYKGKGKGSAPFKAELIKAEQTREQMKQQMAGEIKKQLAGMPELSKLLGAVDVKVEADGINIEIMDSNKESMFEVGSSTINPLAKAAFLKISEVIKTSPNNIDIVGHTDARPFGRGFKGYTNWELSADRGNSARRLLEEAGIPSERITSVIGKADRELKFPQDPNNEMNRRITLKIRFPKNIDAPTNATLLPEALANQIEDDEDKEPVHSMTPQEILQKSKEKKEQAVQLPDLNIENYESTDENIENPISEFPIITDGLPNIGR